eukprot:12928970-Prorocentrum_lima.AAC.1
MGPIEMVRRGPILLESGSGMVPSETDIGTRVYSKPFNESSILVVPPTSHPRKRPRSHHDL